jgi:hypothetical protein
MPVGDSQPERGCDYCADAQNMHYGHVEQIASSELRRTVLIRCPRCGWLYEDEQVGEPDHVTDDDAAKQCRGLSPLSTAPP